MPVGAFSRCVPWDRYPLLLFASDQNPLDLVEAHLVAPPVIESDKPVASHRQSFSNRAGFVAVYLTVC
jgi:hypothetical protein